MSAQKSWRAVGRLLVAFALLAALLAPMAQPVPATATTWVVDTASRTEAQVQEKWARLKPVYSGSPYAVSPSMDAPYATGTLESGFVRDGLNTLNFARYLAGLPDDVTLSAARNREAQHGAVLLGATRVLTHFPTKPSDMTQSFFDAGYDSARSSNIGFGHSTLATFQGRCLNDNSSEGNLRAVGHRRWLLNPTMRVTGMGYADGWVTTYAFDRSRPAGDVSYSAITWPSAGAFPVEMFCNQTPWSITLNPEVFDIDQGSTKHTVTLRRVADGRTWSFGSNHTNTSGHYFSTDFRWMGVPNVFVFRPDPGTVTYRRGDVFDVTLSVYVKGRSTPRTVTYRTQFVSMEGGDIPGFLHAEDSSRLIVGQTLSRAFAYDGALDSVYFDARRGVELEISSPGVRTELYDSSGRLLQVFAGTRTEMWTPPSDGRYYLLAEDSPIGRSPVRYELSVIDPLEAPLRVEGSNRWETAVEASELAFPGGSEYVVIATGLNWPDALGGTALAGALDAPILLTGRTVPAATAAEIERLGASKAVIVGGTHAVNREVEAELKRQLGSANVERISGSDRYQTADRVATRVIAELGSAYDGTAFVATGRNFPDALAAAPIAAAQGWPLFLSDPGSGLSDATKATMGDKVRSVVILGGTGVVPSMVESYLDSEYGDSNVERIAGVNRYETSKNVASWGVARTDLEWCGVAIATGRDFPDALGGGVLQGISGSVLLLSDPRALSPEPGSAIELNRDCIETFAVLGGTKAVSHEVSNTVIEILH